ncbi:glycosyltransferase family 39 protein [Luteimonas vadosa]|uniref:Glycosyltransferase family 39 protein n=1 Tax=Luteimonas vadosa TaxID=1165507 RepID=A0ABP9DPB4_9GAMM
MLETRHSRDVWLLAVVAVLVLGAGMGLRDPWPADEPRFALVAKQMVDSGQWLFPQRGTELYSDKPPMLMWLQATANTLVREWRIAFLLPSLLAALGTLWCVYDLGRRLWTPRVGIYAAWALLFAFQFTFQAKKAQIDPLVTFWITLANYGLLRHFLKGPDWRMWTLGWFAAGLGTITKGVGALALLMVLPALFALWRGWLPTAGAQARGALLRDGRFWLGPLAFVLAAGLWLGPMVSTALTHPDPAYRAYLDDILFRQTVQRYTQSWDHHKAAWYHFGVMASLWLPMALAFPWAIPAWRRRLRRRDARYLLPLVWWALVVVFFSIPDGKRDVYIMPALPMACLAVAPLVPGLLRKRWPPRLALGFIAGLGLATLVVGAALLLGDFGFERKLVAERGLHHHEALQLGWFLLAIAGWITGVVLWFGARRGAHAAVAGLAGLWVVFGLIGYPILNRSSSAAEVMTEAGRLIGPDAELGMVAWREQNMYEADRPVTTFGFGKEEHWGTEWDVQWHRGAAWLRQAPERRWLFVLGDSIQDCVDRTRAIHVGIANRRDWWLVPAAALPRGCPDHAVPTRSR